MKILRKKLKLNIHKQKILKVLITLNKNITLDIFI